MNILKMNNLKTEERKKDKMVSIEYVHKLLELYNQLCSPLCQQTGISQTSLDILMFLKNNPQYKNAADIVKFRGIKANLVSVHVERLVQEGYLERQEVPGDRRKTELICTEKAAHVWKHGCEIQKAFFEMLFSGVPEESRKIFEHVMEQTEENLNIYQKENKKK